AAPGAAAGKQGFRASVHFGRTRHGAPPILHSAAPAPPPIPYSHYPKQKNRRKRKQQINRDQGGEANSNHGVALPGRLACGRVMSLPHSIVAIPQVKSASGLLSPGAFLGKRQRARQRGVWSSIDAS